MVLPLEGEPCHRLEPCPRCKSDSEVCTHSTAPVTPNRRISHPCGCGVLRYFDKARLWPVLLNPCSLYATRSATARILASVAPRCAGYTPPRTVGTRGPYVIASRLRWRFGFFGTKKDCSLLHREQSITRFGSKTPFGGRWLFSSGASAFLILIINEKLFDVKHDFSELVFGCAPLHNMLCFRRGVKADSVAIAERLRQNHRQRWRTCKARAPRRLWP